MSDPSNVARIERLLLQNFRPFEHLELELHPRLTVLVAENGGGKTTILDAVSLILQAVLDPLVGKRKHISLSDVRKVTGRHGELVGVYPTAIHAWGSLFGETGEWYIARGSASKADLEENTSTARDLKPFLDAAVEYTAGKRAKAPLFPLIAYYGARRGWEDNQRKVGPWLKRTAQHSGMDRSSGYWDAFTPTHHYLLVREWFKRLFSEARAGQQSLFQSPYEAEKRLAVVQRATDYVLRPVGWHALEWDFMADTLIATHPQKGRFPVDSLSEGIRSILGVVADLAYRASHLNPHLGEKAALESPGIVLIDEVDLHLHPRWQQEIISALLEAFPGVQFMVTTHSPHVLSSVEARSIRVLSLDNDAVRVETPRFQTRGVESSDVLAAIMGVDPVPHVEETKLLREYQTMIEAGQAETEAGLTLRSRLEAHFGAMHPVMLDCERLLRFKSFKLRIQAEKKEGG
ncbi:MAG: AAA family ATPase [Myxococcota bacterium]